MYPALSLDGHGVVERKRQYGPVIAKPAPQDDGVSAAVIRDLCPEGHPAQVPALAFAFEADPVPARCRLWRAVFHVPLPFEYRDKPPSPYKIATAMSFMSATLNPSCRLDM